MIKLFRIDHRLLHGQVAFSWTKSIGADCILVADDEATTNSLKMTTSGKAPGREACRQVHRRQHQGAPERRYR